MIILWLVATNYEIIIQNKVDIPGTVRHRWWFTTSFSDEYVFVVVNEVVWYAVRLIVFDKPQKRGRGNLQVFKVSEHWTFNGAKERAEELRYDLRNLSFDRNLPVLSFLNNKKMLDVDVDVKSEVQNVINQSVWVYEFYLSVSEADDYLRPFDILKIDRGWFEHVAVYLGKDYVCHFSGNKAGSSNSGGMKVKKDTLKNFFNGENGYSVKVFRPIIRFKSRDKVIKDLARAIASEYGKHEYDSSFNNCEHFAKMMVLGIKHSSQYHLGFERFTSSRYVNLKEEIEECDGFINNLTSPSQGLIREIEELTEERVTYSLGNWETRIEVNKEHLGSQWCKIQ